MAMGREHPFSFTLAMSLFVDRDCQDELDPLHSKLVESDLDPMPLAEDPLSRDSDGCSTASALPGN
jgi:predicted 3-demethylubiquinone-9 3-methyltransferase (glyoxalase superfamily)